MRATLHAPLPALSRPPLTLAEALALVESGELTVVTSDVFDTVVWRPVAQPHHLFRRVAERLLADGKLAHTVDPHGFGLARQRAEHATRVAARAAHGCAECTLAELWAAFPASIWRNGAGPADGCAAELAAEAEALRLHPTAASVLTAARRAGVAVVLVSDSYFSGAEVAELVTAAGLDIAGLGIEVVTSSDRRKNKWEGLLGDVVAEHGGAAGALHVGDNPFADLVIGDRLGARVAAADILDVDDAARTAHAVWDRLSYTSGSDGGQSGAVRETLVRAGATGRDPSYQFGVEVAGPVMAGFAGWVSATAEQLGAGALHCLLREGARIAELIDIVRPSGPKRVLVHASRWAIMRAAVIEGTPRELERALARRATMHADHVAEAFGCDPDAVASVLGTRIVANTDRSDAYAAMSADPALRDEIVAASAELRRGVLAYLERTLVIDDGPLVLTDIGWGATIQEGLQAILTDAGIYSPVVGLYALVSPPGEIRAGEGAQVRSYLPTTGAHGESYSHAVTAVRHPEFLERINTPATGTLLGFGPDGEPVTRPDDHDAISPSLALAQRGVLDFCSTVTELALDDPQLAEQWIAGSGVPAAALEALATTIAAPDPRLAAALGTWQHDDVAGTAAEELSSAGFRRWVRYANGVDVADIAMNEVYWVPGVASAAGSGLASQIEALAAGAHPDTVAPPSPAGLARIAVFPPGSALAEAQVETVPRLGGEGWMLLRFDGTVTGVRSIRVDVGSVDVLADVADALVTIDDEPWIDGAAALQAAGRWVEGRWIGSARAAVAAGGHLLLDPPIPVTASARVAVTVAVRAWALDPDSRRELLPRWRAVLPVAARAARRTATRLSRR